MYLDNAEQLFLYILLDMMAAEAKFAFNEHSLAGIKKCWLCVNLTEHVRWLSRVSIKHTVCVTWF